MQKLVLLFVLSLFYNMIAAQDFNLILENEGKSKKLRINCNSEVIIGMNLSDDDGRKVFKILKGKTCKRTGDSLFVYPAKVTEEIINKEGTIRIKKIDQSIKPLEKSDLIPININDMLYIQKVKLKQLRFGGISMFLSGAAMVILNPLLNYNFESGVINGKRWLNMHLVESGIILGGIILTVKNKGKKYYLKSNLEGKKVYKFISEQ